MNRKLLVLVLLLAILALVAAYFWWPTTDTGERTGIGAIFPIGDRTTSTDDRASATGSSAPVTNTGTSVAPGYQPTVPFRQLVSVPVAGATIRSIATTTLRYMERATGYLYDLDLSTTTRETVKVTNTTLPGVHDVAWLEIATTTKIIARYVRAGQPEIFFGSILSPARTATGTDAIGRLEGRFLPTTTYTIVPGPDRTSFFILRTENGDTVGEIMPAVGNATKTIFRSKFNEWTASWPTPSLIILATKPAASIPGYAYALDVKTGLFTKIAGPVTGLTVLPSPDGTKLLGSESSGGVHSFILDIASGTTTKLQGTIIPEKCVWAKNGVTIFCALPRNLVGQVFPDAWYRGETSFNDTLVRLNAVSGDITTLYEPAAGEIIDGINLALNAAENLLVLRDKRTSTLWSLTLR